MMDKSFVFNSLVLFSLMASLLCGANGREVLVLANADNVESMRLARLYQELRGVPPHHLLALPFSSTSEIGHREFDRVVRAGVQRWIREHADVQLVDVPVLINGERRIEQEIRGSSIRYLVSTWGVPYGVGDSKGKVFRKLEREHHHLGDQRNHAAFDSEAALACWNEYPREGGLRNPFRDTRPGSPVVLMATRLDGPTPERVEQRLRETLRAEKAGWEGAALIDAQGIRKGGYAMGDRWLMNSAQLLQAHGNNLLLDTNAALVAAEFHLPDEGIGFYLGWYAEHPEGLFAQPDWSFSEGAIAAHLHSFAGHRPRDPSRYWLGPLMERGAVAGFGSLHEPYLGGVPQLDLFTRLLLEGNTFGESVYGSMPLLSWQTVILGDPLYRPFRP